MAQLQQTFDATQTDPTQGGSYLKAGRHRVQIAASELVENSAKTGGFLQLTLESVEAETMGQQATYRLNLYHTSQKVVEIAHKQLSAICHVIGVYQVQDSAQLHGKPFIIDLANQPLTEEQKEKEAAGDTVTPFTEVKKVFDMNECEPGKTTPTPQATPQAQTTTPAQQPATQTEAQPATTGQPSWGQPTVETAPDQQAAQVAANTPSTWQQNEAPAAQASAPSWGK